MLRYTKKIQKQKEHRIGWEDQTMCDKLISGFLLLYFLLCMDQIFHSFRLLMSFRKLFLRGAIILNHFIRSEVLYGMNSPFEQIQPFLPCLFFSRWTIPFIIRLKFIWHMFLFSAVEEIYSRVLRILRLRIWPYVYRDEKWKGNYIYIDYPKIVKT